MEQRNQEVSVVAFSMLAGDQALLLLLFWGNALHAAFTAIVGRFDPDSFLIAGLLVFGYALFGGSHSARYLLGVVVTAGCYLLCCI